jgi:Sec-independent protein secretion pathway component TatC
LKTSYVTSRRRYIYAALYIVTAVVTPDGGPIADIALFVPMAVLLELAVLFGRRYEKRGEVYHRQQLGKPTFTKCRYCGSLMGTQQAFCPTCRKAQL